MELGWEFGGGVRGILHTKWGDMVVKENKKETGVLAWKFSGGDALYNGDIIYNTVNATILAQETNFQGRQTMVGNHQIEGTAEV